MKYAVILVALLAGCAAVSPVPAPTPTPTPTPAPATGSVPGAPSVAIAGLMESARADAGAGRYAKAAASLERALRIEPRNPRLWHELARVRLKQGEYQQAESIAARSNSWAAGDSALRAENWRLIAEARAARGDEAGARSALERSRGR